MLKIRLQRTGRINQPSYRIIVTEHARSPKTGNFVEELGTYNPATKAHTLKEDRVKYWLSVGAQASGTMHNMLVRLGVVKGKKINVLPKKTVAKPEAPEGEAALAAPVQA
jgi:small subunit ribosomal protein S16